MANKRPTRVALLVATNYTGQPGELGECEADMTDRWAPYLESRGYVIRFLLGPDAHRSAIVTEVSRLVHESRRGDRIVLGYSGHGTEVRDRDGDESGSYDQAVCPNDYRTAGFLVDDDLRRLLGGLPAGVGFTSVMDCCFSGTITRLLDRSALHRFPLSRARRARFLPRSRDFNDIHLDTALTPGSPTGLATVRASTPTDNWVNLGACLPTEVAYETPGEGGDFTRLALSVLRTSGKTVSVKGFRDRVIKAFGNHRDQTPTVDCSHVELRRVLFGSRRRW